MEDGDSKLGKYRRQIKSRLQGENPSIEQFTSIIKEAAPQNIKKA
jgi:hypothetical protein